MVGRQNNEELRGLFVLGLLAVIVSIKIQYSKIPFTLGATTTNLIPFLDITLVLWSLYAFFMVLGLSKDILGNSAASAFGKVAKMFLYFDFISMGVLSLGVGFYAYPTRLPYILAIILVLVFYSVGKSWKKVRRNRTRWGKLLKSRILRVLGLSVIFCAILIMFYPEEQYVFPFFVASLFSTLLYLFVADYVTFKVRESETSKTPNMESQHSATED